MGLVRFRSQLLLRYPLIVCDFLDLKCKMLFAIDSASWIHLISSCAIHGGAAYLVARIISILLIGVPMLFFELSLGQMSGMGPIKLFGNLRPVFTGVGIFLMISSVYKSIYNTALALWPLSKVMQVLLVDLDIESKSLDGLKSLWQLMKVNG